MWDTGPDNNTKPAGNEVRMPLAHISTNSDTPEDRCICRLYIDARKEDDGKQKPEENNGNGVLPDHNSIQFWHGEGDKRTGNSSFSNESPGGGVGVE